MAKFIGPVIDDVIAILQKHSPELLGAVSATPFVDFGKAFTGVVANFPSVWVMPVRTLFGPEGQLVSQQHQIQIKFGITGSEPNDLEVAGTVYMKALDDSIQSATASDWTVIPTRVFVQQHDYGPLFQRGAVMAKFPELHLLIETEELPT